MTKKIQVLPEHISQAIAAGEVVERPASVVKELIENAIDAGSTAIVVELEAGGLQRIRVCDNGEGMDDEDAPLALQRYATSKIRSVDDLYAIHTLGFRGEALPSIASVSRMIIKTRIARSVSGTQVICEGGKIRAVSEVGCPPGTEVEVKNLFYNLPVKRKFLRSIRSELRYALSLFLRLSLSHPAISFKLTHDGRVLHDLPKTESFKVRTEAILGRDVYDHLRELLFEDKEIRISGFMSLPSISRGNADGIYLYVNGRFIKDRMIHRAVVEAYRHILPANRFPIAVLFITLPSFLVDVNVHPTKTEVKFRDQEKVFHSVLQSLRTVLDPTPRSEDLGLEKVKREPAESGTPMISLPVQRLSFTESGYFPAEREADQKISDAAKPGWCAGVKGSFRVVGQIQGTYIVCEMEGGVVLIDQHAAHERILFERYKKAYEAGDILSERFLIPVLMELSAEDSFLLESQMEAFYSAGFEIDPVGHNVYAIRSIPAFLSHKDPQAMVREGLDGFSALRREGKGGQPIETILTSLACHSAVRGNSVLRGEELEELMKNLAPFHSTATCPHGRPLFFMLSFEEIRKAFKRK